MSDVDAGGRCTGECCWNITLRANGGRGDVLTWPEIAQRQRDHAEQMRTENHLERFLAPVGDHLSCTNYDYVTQRCAIYADRPETCRTYPQETIQNGHLSDTCRFCGFTAPPAQLTRGADPE